MLVIVKLMFEVLDTKVLLVYVLLRNVFFAF